MDIDRTEVLTETDSWDFWDILKREKHASTRENIWREKGDIFTSEGNTSSYRIARMMKEGKSKGRFPTSIFSEKRVDRSIFEAIKEIMDYLFFSYRYGYVVECKHADIIRIILKKARKSSQKWRALLYILTKKSSLKSGDCNGILEMILLKVVYARKIRRIKNQKPHQKVG
jgi:hypothetical protein